MEPIAEENENAEPAPASDEEYRRILAANRAVAGEAGFTPEIIRGMWEVVGGQEL